MGCRPNWNPIEDLYFGGVTRLLWGLTPKWGCEKLMHTVPITGWKLVKAFARIKIIIPLF
jgi:hypothetical protein